MVKRATKRRFRNTVVLIVYGVLGFLALVSLIYIANNFLPKIFNLMPNSSGPMLKPIANLTTANDIRSKLADKDIIVDTINDASISGTIIADIKDGPTIYFSASADASSQVTSLQLILARLTIDNKKIQFIDLRGLRPIVKFSSL